MNNEPTPQTPQPTQSIATQNVAAPQPIKRQFNGKLLLLLALGSIILSFISGPLFITSVMVGSYSAYYMALAVVVCAGVCSIAHTIAAIIVTRPFLTHTLARVIFATNIILFSVFILGIMFYVTIFLNIYSPDAAVYSTIAQLSTIVGPLSLLSIVLSIIAYISRDSISNS